MSSANSHNNGAFYVDQYLAFSFKDATGAVIAPPVGLNDGSDRMWFNSEEIKDIEVAEGPESVVYTLGNSSSAMQSKPQPIMLTCTVTATSPATDHKLSTLRSYINLGYKPSCILGSGYQTGNGSTGDWTSNNLALSPCTVEFPQMRARIVGRGQGLLTDISVELIIRQSVDLVLPGTSTQSGGSGQ